MKTYIPEKPETTRAQVNMLWDGLFNHLPTTLRAMEKWNNIRFGFIMTFMALIIALLGITILR